MTIYKILIIFERVDHLRAVVSLGRLIAIRVQKSFEESDEQTN